MRVIILLKTGEHYVCDTQPTVTDGFLTAWIATGGRLAVPVDNVKAYERYDDGQEFALRQRLAELREEEK